MLEEVQKELSAFGRAVVKQSRTNLTKMKRNDTKDLYHSLSFEAKAHARSFSFSFYMLDYGAYIDEGVRGVGGVRKTTSKYNRSNNKGKMWKQNAPNSPFSFKANKKPSPKHFKEWAKRKGISPFAVSYSVWKQGIKPSLFFTKPFEQAFAKLPDEMIEKFGLDIDTFLEQALNN